MPDRPCHDDITTTTTRRHCPVCQRPFTPVRRQQYCSDGCRKTAWARRHAASAPTPAPPPGPRRDVTVYTCPTCNTRYYGQQWCPDCNQPCTRVGLGGLCPHCDEPIALTDLLNPQEATTR